MRPKVFKIVGVSTKHRTVAPLKQFQPPNFMIRVPISFEEAINVDGQRNELRRYLDNREKLGLKSLQLGQQLTISKIEVNNGIEKLLQMGRAVEG